MAGTQAFRNALHVPTADPAAGRTATVVTPGDEYEAFWQIAGGVPDAPPTGELYARDGLAEVWEILPVMSPAEILANLITVDGSGSGLDADLLDGQHGAYYRSWNNLTGKPSTFPPDLPIPMSGVTDLVATLNSKADITYVDAELALKADLAYVNAGLATKADTAYVDAGLAEKADQDWVQAELDALSVTIGTKLDDAPSDGTQYARMDGSWVPVEASGGAATYVGIDPPPAPEPGQLWWDSDSGKLLIWYDDGNTTQWVEASNLRADLSNYPRESSGDFLPDLSFSGNKPGLTYSDRWGRWRRWGQTCTYWWEFTLSALGTGNGTAGMPLPFTAAAGGLIAGTVGYTNAIAAGYANMSCYVSTDRTRLVISRPSATTNETGMTAAGEGTFTNTSRVAGSITYEVA